MPSNRPFFEPDGSLDGDQIRREAEPLVKLVGLFAGLAFVPLLVVFAIGGPSPITATFVVLAQFLLAVGTGITLMYVIVRALALADGETTHATIRPDPGTGGAAGVGAEGDDSASRTDSSDVLDDREESATSRR